jgi:tetratricopeptide (TPR) repeat protein
MAVEQKNAWSELSFYQGMAYRKLGQDEAADGIFSGLIRYARERLETAAEMDFFAKFGERQSAERRRAQAHYLLGLAYRGTGEVNRANDEFRKTLELDPHHIWANHYLSIRPMNQ